MQSLPEKQIVQELIQNDGCLGDAIFFATAPALNLDDELTDSILHIATEVPREILGLELGKKPGDIDLLIIPEKNQAMIFERTIAIEVKIVRPTIKKPGKNAGKMGATQIQGLIDDGFPFVGLLHIEVPEETPLDFRTEMPNGFMMDLFPLDSAERQQGRLNKLGLPSFVGFSSTGLQSLEGNFIGSSFGFDKDCELNPFINSLIIKRIKKLYESNSYKFTKHPTYG
jgi:hypothetical protein